MSYVRLSSLRSVFERILISACDIVLYPRWRVAEAGLPLPSTQSSTVSSNRVFLPPLTLCKVNRRTTKPANGGGRAHMLPSSWQPTRWLAADSGITLAVACKYATCQAKITTKRSIRYFTKIENDWRRWQEVEMVR